MRTKAGSSSCFCRNVQVPLGYRPWCRVLGGLFLAYFKLEAVPTAQSLPVVDSRNSRSYSEGGNLVGQMETL